MMLGANGGASLGMWLVVIAIPRGPGKPSRRGTWLLSPVSTRLIRQSSCKENWTQPRLWQAASVVKAKIHRMNTLKLPWRF